MEVIESIILRNCLFFFQHFTSALFRLTQTRMEPKKGKKQEIQHGEM